MRIRVSLKRFLLLAVFLLSLSLVFWSVTAQDSAATVLLQQGQQQLTDGDADAALATFESAIDAFKTEDNRQGEADAIYYSGLAYAAQGDYRSARDRGFAKALGIYRDELGDQTGTGRAYHQMGVMYFLLGDEDNALAYYRQGLRVTQQSDDLLEEALILSDLGDLSIEQKDYSEASDNYQKSYTSMISLGETEKQGSLLFKLAETNFFLWDLDQAQDYFEQAADLYNELDRPLEEARALQGVARIYHHIGDLNEAITWYQQALPLFQQTGDNTGEARVLAALGNIYYQQGFSAARDYLEQAENIQQRADVGDVLGLAQTTVYIGDLNRSEGQHRQAKSDFQKALQALSGLDEILDQADFNTLSIEASAYHGLARTQIEGELDNFRTADNNFGAALDIFRYQLNDPWSSRRVFIDQAWAYHSIDRDDDALNLFEQAVNEARQIDDSLGQAQGLIEIAKFHLDHTPPDYNNALKNYDRALDRLEDVDEPHLAAEVYYASAQIYQSQAQYEEARIRLERALENYQASDDLLGEALTSNNLGQIYQQQGSDVDAFATYQNALEDISNISGELTNDDLIDRTTALIYQNLGVIYAKQQLYEDAADSFDEAENIQDDKGYTFDLALTLAYQGDLLLAQDDYSGATSIYNSARRQGTESKNLRAMGIANQGLGVIYARSSRTDLQERTSFDDALENFREINDPLAYAGVLRTQAWLAFGEGDVDKAEGLLSEARNKAKEVRDERTEAYILLDLARLYRQDPRKEEAFKKFAKSINTYREALRHFERIGDYGGQAQVWEGLGEISFSQSKYSDALSNYQQMQIAYASAGNRTGEGRALGLLGQVYQVLGRYDLASSNYSSAQEAIEDFDDDTDLTNERLDQIQLAVVLRNLGSLYRELEQYTEAQELLDQAEDIQQENSDSNGRGITLSFKGELSITLRNYDDALSFFLEAGNIAANNNDAFGHALSCYGLARVYTAEYAKTGDSRNARDEENNYDCALNLFRSDALDPVRERQVLISLGHMYLERYQYTGSANDLEQATTWFNTASNASREAQDRVGEAYALIELANLSLSQLDFSTALSTYSKADQRLKNGGDNVARAEVLSRIADVYRRQVRYDLALEQYQEMILLYHDEEDLIREGLTESLIGEIYYLESNYALALSQHLKARDEVLEAKDSLPPDVADTITGSAEARINRNIASVRMAMAQYDLARTDLDTAFELAVSSGDQLEEAAVSQQRANLDSITNQDNSCPIKGNLGTFDESGTIFDTFNGVLGVYENFGEIFLQGQLYLDIGDAHFLCALAAARTDDRASSDYNRTVANINYQKALGVARKGDLVLSALAQSRIGRILAATGRADEARSRFTDALDIAEQASNPVLQSSILIDLGLLDEAQNRPGDAVERYLSAIQIDEGVHANIRLRLGQIAFASQTITPYQRLVQYYFRTGDPTAAFEYAEGSRTRTFSLEINNEQLDFGANASADTLDRWQKKRTELSVLQETLSSLTEQFADAEGSEKERLLDEIHSIQDEQIPDLVAEVVKLEEQIEAEDQVLTQLTGAAVPTLEEIQAAIPEGTTVVAYYIVSPPSQIVRDQGQLYAFILTHDTFEPFALPQSISSIETGVNAFLSNREGGSFDSSTAHLDLYKWLIEPLNSKLPGSGNLVIIPHGILNYLPFSALAATPDHYLSDDYTISYSPSASFYALTVANVPKLTTGQIDAIIIGNPNTDLGLNLDYLPFAEDEAEAVATTLESAYQVEGDATETLVRDNAEKADVIHIAAHGVYNQKNSLSTYIALAPDLTSGNDGKLEVREIYSLSLNDRAPLVVLSACNSATGELSTGDELQSLARAFLVKGAHAVVASLWEVDDAATAYLMTQFYQYRNEGWNEAEALQKAQADVRNYADENWKAPKYWAAFVLIGVPASNGNQAASA